MVGDAVFVYPLSGRLFPATSHSRLGYVLLCGHYSPTIATDYLFKGTTSYSRIASFNSPNIIRTSFNSSCSLVTALGTVAAFEGV